METGQRVGIKPPLYVVRITGKAVNGAPVIGTGFIVDAQGHVATCRHVVVPTADGQQVTELHVKLPYPAERPYAYQVMAASSEDLAILECTVPLDFPVPEPLIHDDWARDTRSGDAVTVWGYSAAEHYTQAQRFDCAVSGFAGPYGRIGLSGNVNSGDSGGPVLDANRRVIGVAQARDAKRDGQAMAIPVSLLRNLMRENGVGPSRAAGGAEAIFQAPSLPDYALVGRDLLLHDLKGQLAGGRHVALCFKPGVGKSALAIALANDSDMRSRYDAGVLWASLNLTPNVLSELKKWGVALGMAHEEMEELDRLASDAGADRDEGARQAVRQWAAALSRQIGQRRMLLVIDDAWDIESAKALLLDAPNCSHLVTTREQVTVAAMLGGGFDITVVGELTEDDGIAFLRELAPNAVDLFPQEARDLFRAVGGLPQGLLLLGMHLRQVSRDARRRRIGDAYREIQNTLETLIQPLFGAIQIGYDALPDDQARRALRALSTFRPKPGKFSEDAAVAVLDMPASVIDQLNDSGLIETLNSGDDPNDLPYTMHRTIADFAGARLAADEAQALHRRAAAYFSNWLKQFDEADHDSEEYGYQYRYENARWQDAMDDFLYHLARSGDPAAAILGFGSIYFNAFWWWGCYADFPFCTRLLQQAATKRLSDESRHALELLTAFDAAYPKETEREAGADWAKVEATLRELRALGGLAGDASSVTDADARHTRALTDIFLAEAFRFGRGDSGEAERLYGDALSLLPDNDWSRPWVLYHTGDLFLESGRFEDAERCCAACLAIAQDPAIRLTERDHEVIANAYRLSSELAARRGRFDDVLDGCQRAVLHAYGFQAVPEPPDAYTASFYRQMTSRIARLIQAIHCAEPARAMAACGALRDYWLSYRKLSGAADDARTDADVQTMLEAESTDDLCAYLFPAAPEKDAMHVRGSRYFNEAIALFNEKTGKS